MISEPRRRIGGAALLALTLSLAACATGPLSAPPPDPEVARLNQAVATQAASFYAGLPAKTAPDCALAANQPAYDAMRADAVAMEQRVAATPGDDAMRRAASGLAGTIDAAEQSHRLASAKTDDRFGACMSPGAITLNADAVARATKAIGDLQTARGQ